MKHKIVLLVTIAMVMTMLFGCTASPTTSTQATTKTAEQTTASSTAEPTTSVPEYLNLDSTYPLVKEGSDITLKIYCANAVANIDPKKNWIWAFYEEYGNIKCDVKYYDATAWPEQKNLIFASQDLPDIFYSCLFSRDDLVNYGQVEGMFLDLKDLISDYAPLLQTAFNSDPSLALACTTPDGKMYTAPLINSTVEEKELRSSGPHFFINSVWLENLGLSNPETLNELTAVLTAFKTGDPNENGLQDEIPFEACYSATWTLNAEILTALGINANTSTKTYLKDDGTVAIPFMEPRYADYLKYVKMLLDNGLLEADYFTITADQAQAKMAANVVGAAQMAAPFLQTPDHYKDYISMNPLTSSFNSTKIWPITLDQVTVGQFAAAYNTEYPEVCARFVNTHYTEDAPVLFWTGQYEGFSMLVDGWDVTKVAFDADGNPTPVWPECESTNGWQLELVTPIYGAQPFGFSDYGSAFYKVFNITKPVVGDTETRWRNSYLATVSPYTRQMIPELYFAPEQLDRKAALETPIFDYVNSMESKYLMGKESIDNMDAYYSQLKSLGIDEYLKIIQDAYNSYAALAD